MKISDNLHQTLVTDSLLKWYFKYKILKMKYIAAKWETVSQ